MIPDDLGSVEYVVVANDLLLALIREVEELRIEHRGLTKALTGFEISLRPAPSTKPPPWAGAQGIVPPEMALIPSSTPEPQPEVEPAALSEVDQARREAAAEEAAFRARVAQGEVEGDGIIDTSTWPVHELGDTGGFR